MINILLIGILVAIVAAIAGYLWRAKKRGATCIGCPHACECAKRHTGGCHEK